MFRNSLSKFLPLVKRPFTSAISFLPLSLPPTTRWMSASSALGSKTGEDLVQHGFELARLIDVLPEVKREDYLISTIGLEKINKVVRNGDDLVRLLKSLPRDRRQLFLGRLNVKAILSVESTCGLSDVLECLSSEGGAKLLGSMGPQNVKEITRSYADLKAISCLDNAYKDGFLAASFEKVKGMIQEMNDMRPVLAAIPEMHRVNFVTKIWGVKDAAALIRNGRDLACLLRYIPPASEGFILNTIKPLIQNSKDLEAILRSMPEENREAYLATTFGQEISALIKNCSDLSFVSALPEANQLVYITKTLGLEKIKALIKNGKDLADVLYILPVAHRVTFLTKLGNIEDLFKSKDDLERVLNKLPEEGCWACLTTLLKPEKIKALNLSMYWAPYFPEKYRISYMTRMVNLEDIKKSGWFETREALEFLERHHKITRDERKFLEKFYEGVSLSNEKLLSHRRECYDTYSDRSFSRLFSIDSSASSDTIEQFLKAESATEKFSILQNFINDPAKSKNLFRNFLVSRYSEAVFGVVLENQAPALSLANLKCAL